MTWQFRNGAIRKKMVWNLDQEKDLEFREDGLWYQIGSDSPFTGFADAFHKNGKIRSRTKVKNGLSYGLIEEWDENGTKKGTLLRMSSADEVFVLSEVHFCFRHSIGLWADFIRGFNQKHSEE